MAAFGGYAPLPVRLGGDTETGWSAAQHARAAADLYACSLTSDFAILTVNKSGGTVTIESYLGQNGLGLAAAPLALNSGTGIITFFWPNTFKNDYDENFPVNIKYADAGVIGTANLTASASVGPNTVIVSIYNAATGALTDGRVTVAVGPGITVDRRIGHYDGATDKEDSPTEGKTPYAWIWYREFEGALGTAFTKTQSGLVHAKKIALARMWAALDRLREKYSANAKPGTNDEVLGHWVRLLNVRLLGDDTLQEVRQRAAVRLKAGRGPTMTRVDEAVSELLGAAFVKVWRRYGTDLDTPPAQTYWPGVNPGPTDYSLGGGAWLSERSHLVIEVSRSAGLSDTQFLRLANVDLYRLLDELLPATSTFDWATGLTDGFLLDISDLDFGGLTD